MGKSLRLSNSSLSSSFSNLTLFFSQPPPPPPPPHKKTQNSYLNGTLPADYGFDPLGLSDPEGAGAFVNPKWLAYSEVIHGRWAMLGAAGCIAPEILASAGAIPQSPSEVLWFKSGVIPPAGTYERGYWADPFSLFWLEVVAMQFAELKRWQDYRHPGSQGKQYFLGMENAFNGSGDPAYPGGPWFNMFNLGKTEADMKVLKTKEVRVFFLVFLSVFLVFFFRFFFQFLKFFSPFSKRKNFFFFLFLTKKTTLFSLSPHTTTAQERQARDARHLRLRRPGDPDGRGPLAEPQGPPGQPRRQQPRLQPRQGRRCDALSLRREEKMPVALFFSFCGGRWREMKRVRERER